MKVYETEQIRNIAMVSHGGAGKTTLTEVMLGNTGVLKRIGKVEDGNTTTDYDPEEIKRQITINTTTAPCEWRNHKINILDTPGFADFVAEVRSALRVADGACMVVSAPDGVEVMTEVYWEAADKRNLPRIIFVNKMDRENADFEATLEQLKGQFGNKVAALQIPIGSEDSFEGVVDILNQKAFIFANGKAEEQEIPAEMQDQAAAEREVLVEAIAEADDELLMKYLEGEELTGEEIERGFKEGVMKGSVYPVLCGSATKNIGITLLMDALVDFMPNPAEVAEEGADASAPFAGLIFKTLADPYVGKLSFVKVLRGALTADNPLFNASKEVEEKIGQVLVIRGKNQETVEKLNFGDIGAIPKLQETLTGDTLCTKANPIIFEGIQFPASNFSVAVSPKNKGDEDKLGSAINKILSEDPTLSMEKNPETGENILTGVGELQLDVAVSKLKDRYGVEVETETPRVPYRETIRTAVAKVEGKYKKQTGGHGQYGHVYINLEPNPDEDFTFEETIFGGSVPKQYIPAVEKGIIEALPEGILAKYPVTNVKATLIDGSYHNVDSSEFAFKLAGSMAFKKAMEMANPVLLEPIVEVEVTVPERFMGDIMGDLNSKRGRIMGMQPVDGNQVIKATVPLSEMGRYVIDLKSITQGRGSFTMKLSGYEEAPPNIAQKVIEAAKSEDQE